MTIYIRKNNILAESLEDHLVMLDLEKGKYFSLNSVAKRIWESLEQPQSSKELCQILLNEFEVDEAQCKKEVQEHLAEMVQLKLISEVE